MAPTDNFRKQHVDIMAAANDLAALLDPARLVADAAKARNMLSALFGKLTIHLAMEDKSLYPRLVAHADPAVSKMAKAYAGEMSNLAPVIADFGKKWSESEIRTHAAAFCTETKHLFDVLKKRIARENAELYPLADKVG